MPFAPLRPCRYPRCPGLARSGYCDKHKSERRRYDRERGNSTERLYTYKWQVASRRFLAEHGLCGDRLDGAPPVMSLCRERGIWTPATQVDHCQPHKGDLSLFWDMNNWQALCARCGARKSAKGL
jgi:5-methylcytosine-specific restriction enzyme A